MSEIVGGLFWEGMGRVDAAWTGLVIGALFVGWCIIVWRGIDAGRGLWRRWE